MTDDSAGFGEPVTLTASIDEHAAGRWQITTGWAPRDVWSLDEHLCHVSGGMLHHLAETERPGRASAGFATFEDWREAATLHGNAMVDQPGQPASATELPPVAIMLDIDAVIAPIGGPTARGDDVMTATRSTVCDCRRRCAPRSTISTASDKQAATGRAAIRVVVVAGWCSGGRWGW